MQVQPGTCFAARTRLSLARAIVTKEIKLADLAKPVEREDDRCAEAILDVVPPVVRSIRKMMREHRLPELSGAPVSRAGAAEYTPDASLSTVADFVGSSLPAASRMMTGLWPRIWWPHTVLQRPPAGFTSADATGIDALRNPAKPPGAIVAAGFDTNR